MKFFWLERKLMDKETGGEGAAGGDVPNTSTPPSETPSQNTPEPTPPKDPQETDGKISETEATLLKDVMKWKKRFKAQEDELGQVRSELKGISELKAVIGDIDTDSLKELITSKKENEREEQEKRGEYDSIVSQMRSEHQKELDAQVQISSSKDEEITSLKSTLSRVNRQVEELTIGRSFNDSVFIKERSVMPTSIARDLYAKHFDVDDGVVVAYDKPASEEGRAPLVDAQGNRLGFEAAIERLITSHPEKEHLLRSTMKTGAGSKTASGKPDSEENAVRGQARIAAALKANSN